MKIAVIGGTRGLGSWIAEFLQKKDFKVDTSDKDEIIGKKITEFQEELALECPMCKKAKVQAKKTITGKNYYKCFNKDCNFISWGKPYHIPCPICRNSFFVEVSDKYGKWILKCPRATCRHWQDSLEKKIPNPKEDSSLSYRNRIESRSISKKPRKRVVRRRLVRGKKQG